MPKGMHVREGISPSKQDDQVRFRTTYYFRVFDFCQDLNGDDVDVVKEAGVKGNDVPATLNQDEEPDPKKDGRTPRKRILSDSLYRFRMTGKASALFTKIHFESGTLSKSQIDPFGATIEYDSRANRFRFKSQARNDEEALYEDIWREIERLRTLRSNLGDSEGKIKEAIDALLLANFAKLGPGRTILVTNTDVAELDKNVKATAQAVNAAKSNSALTSGDAGEVGKATKRLGDLLPKLQDSVEAITKAQKTTANDVACANNLPVRRGFQILGPEGWRTFDQDERLLMVMSTSAKPLVETLRELSDRVLQQESSERFTSEAVLRERVSVLRARREVDSSDDTEAPKIVNQALSAFESEGVKRK